MELMVNLGLVIAHAMASVEPSPPAPASITYFASDPGAATHSPGS